MIKKDEDASGVIFTILSSYMEGSLAQLILQHEFLIKYIKHIEDNST